jgi:hypothetical protein
MTIKALLIGVIAIGLAATPALAKKKPAAPACVKDKVLVSLEMRMLQTELVVGALSCQLTPRYNDFVTAYKSDLMAAHRTLLKWFGRESKMEDYKSKTANEASQRSLANLAEYCSYTTALYDKLLGPQKPSLAAFVATEPVAAHHGFEVCGAPSLVTASAVATDGKTIPMPRFKPDVVVAAQPVHVGKSHAKPAEASAASPEAPATAVPAPAAPSAPATTP